MRSPPPRCQSRVADGARLTDRPQGTGRPFGLRTPPAVELAASPMPNAGQKKSAGIEDGRWCALWFQAVKPGCGVCRSGWMVLSNPSGCQSDFSHMVEKGALPHCIVEGNQAHGPRRRRPICHTADRSLAMSLRCSYNSPTSRSTPLRTMLGSSSAKGIQRMVDK